MKLVHALSISLMFALLTACGGGEASASSGGSSGSSDSSGSSGSSNDIRKYELESAIIEFQLTGFPSGTETLHFDRYGAREATVRDHVIEMGAIRQETKGAIITEGAWITTVDDTARSATRTRNPLYEKIAEAMKGENAKDVGERMMKGMGGKKTGTEEIAGRMCDVWEIPSLKSRTWIWKGLTLKVEVKMPGMSSSKVATSVKENPSIPDSRFEIPDGYAVKEVDLSGLLKK